MSAPQIDIAANKRVPFDDAIAIMGVNYTGATATAEIRVNPGDQGAALVTLSTTTPPAQGLSISYDPDYPDPEGVLPNGASLLRMIIGETTLEGLAYGADPAKPVDLSYDIHLTPSGGTKTVFCAGRFTINPGVTL